MASTATLIAALNTIRANASPSYAERVPVATQTNLSEVGNPILSYSTTTNEFLNALVNRISMVLVRNRELRNPLEILKQGTNPLGMDIEEIATNPAKAEKFDPKATDLLKQSDPDVFAAYHRMNRQDVYTVTVSNQRLRTAFTSWEKLEELINSIVNSLYSGNYLDEFVLAKRLFASAIADGKIQTVNVPAITDAESAKAFITASRLIFRNFGFPSAAYNSYGKIAGDDKKFTTWTPPEDIRFILRSDAEAYVDVEVLARAYNLTKSDFLGQVLIVDDFDTATNCVAIMCDKAFTQIYDNQREMTEFYNAKTLSWNYYLHVWQTYSISPFANAVAFVTG